MGAIDINELHIVNITKSSTYNELSKIITKITEEIINQSIAKESLLNTNTY